MSDVTSTLDEMCELIIDCPHFTPEWTTSGYLVIRNQNIRNGRLDLSERSYTNLEDFERRIRRAKPQAGDIIFTREAPMGEVCLIPEGLECCVGQRQVLLRPAQDVDHRYLFYALRSPWVRHQIMWNEGTGSTVSNVRIPILKAIKIPRMGAAELGIGEFLDNLDGKIELNRRMNETLEAMAQTVFRDWFVDFGPTRRKLSGVTDPFAIMGGLTPPARAAELSAMFPDWLSEGELPNGWGIEPLDEIATFTKGRSYKSSELQPSSVALVTLKSFSRGGGYRHDGLKSYSGPYKPEQVVSLGDIVLSQTDVTQAADIIGRPAIVSSQGEFETLVASLDVAVIRSKRSGRVPREYLYQTLRDRRFTQHALAHVTGTTVLHLAKAALPTYEVVSPSDGIPQAFDEICGPFREKILGNDFENRTLAVTRDYLLPRLMSGTVRVGDVAGSRAD